MTDWVTISSLATAGGTLVLAVATFASVRSANRAARAAERALLAGLRPLLVPSRMQDEPEKVGFVDDKWFRVPGGGAVAEVINGSVYLAMSLRNVGNGIAVLHGWHVYPERVLGAEHPKAEDFRRLTRDLYVPVDRTGFWQGALRREADDPVLEPVRSAVAAGATFTVDLLYGDYEGGQRMVSRFAVIRRGDADWFLAASRHWNLDRSDPR